MSTLSGISSVSGDGAPCIFVNGDRRALLEDYRFAVYQYFPEGTVLYDPSYTPSRRVPLGTKGDDIGITRRKLLPYGHYEAFFEHSGSLLPFTRGEPTVAYAMNLPPQTTNYMLNKYFEMFGRVKEVEVFHGRTTPCNGRAVVEMREDKTLQEVPRVLEFYQRRFVFTALSDRKPRVTPAFGPLSAGGGGGGVGGQAGAAVDMGAHGGMNGKVSPLVPPMGNGGARGGGGGQWAVLGHPSHSTKGGGPPAPLPPRMVGSTGSFGSLTSTTDGPPKATNPNLPQPRSSKLAAAAAAAGTGVGAAASAQGSMHQLPRGLAASAGNSGVSSTATPAPRSAMAATAALAGGAPRPASLPPVGPVDAIAYDSEGHNRTLYGFNGQQLQHQAQAYVLATIPEESASAAVRDGVFWPSPDMQQALRQLEEAGAPQATIIFVAHQGRAPPSVFGYARLSLPYLPAMDRNGFCAVEWMRHHIAIRENTLRTFGAQVLLKLRDGSMVKQMIGRNTCNYAESVAGDVRSPMSDSGYGAGARAGLTAPPPPAGIFTPPAGSPVSPSAPLAGTSINGSLSRGPKSVSRAVGSGPASPMQRMSSTGEGPAIPIPASRRAQAAAAAAAAEAAAATQGTTSRGSAPSSPGGDTNDSGLLQNSICSPAPSPIL